MKIVAGLSCIDDYIRLVEAGADEVFVGYVPYEYTKKYGNLFPINRREIFYINTQINSLSDMKILKKMVDKYKVPVSITFNNIYYIEEQYEYIGQIIKDLVSIGFEQFIIADIGIILYLKEHNINCSIQLSGECAETNRLSMDFFNRMNIKRYIFNRKTTIEEMKSCIDYNGSNKIKDKIYDEENKKYIDKSRIIVKSDKYQIKSLLKNKEKFNKEIKKSINETTSFAAASDHKSSCKINMEYEAFILNERCHYTGAFCTSLHCDEMIHLCEMPYQMGKIDELSFDFPSVDEKLEKYYETNIHRHKEKVKEDYGQSYRLGSTGCGLCSLKKLELAGVTHLKVVGRGEAVENIEKDIMYLKKALDLLDKVEELCECGAKLKESLFESECSKKCYYNI